MAPTDWIWIWLDKSNNTLHLILSFIQVIFYNHISVICSFECVCCPLSSVRCKGRKLLTFKLYSLVLTLRLTCQLTTLADKHAKIQLVSCIFRHWCWIFYYGANLANIMLLFCKRIPTLLHQFTLRGQNPPALVLGQLAWVFVVLGVLCECGNSRTALMLFRKIAQTPIHLI